MLSMEFIVATTIGVLTSAAIYLLLRARTFPVILGLALLARPLAGGGRARRDALAQLVELLGQRAIDLLRELRAVRVFRPVVADDEALATVRV